MIGGVNVYLSAVSPRFPLRTESDLRLAITEGLLVENHWVDVKRELPDTGKNERVAKDLAAFSVDGGTILIGVDEPEPGRFVLAPLLRGQIPERLQQVAALSVDPPVTVVVDEIRTDDADDERVYLVVHVPQSPAAPHQAKGQYMRRGDTTNLVMSDAEVRAMHGRRPAGSERAAEILDEEVARRPRVTKAKHSWLCGFAHPVAAGDRVWARRVEVREWEPWFQQIYDLASHQVDAAGAGLPQKMTGRDRRPAGVVALSDGLRPNRQPNLSSTFRRGVDVEFRRDGGIRVFCAPITKQVMSVDWGGPETLTAVPVQAHLVEEAELIRQVRMLLGLALAAADDTGYTGNWLIGLAMGGVDGAGSLILEGGVRDVQVQYPHPGDEVREHVEVTRAQMLQAPGWITDQLLGPTLRVLGSADSFPGLLSDPAPGAVPVSDGDVGVPVAG